MEEPKFTPKEHEEAHSLDLTGPPEPERHKDTDSYDEQWDTEEDDYDDYDTEDDEEDDEETEDEESESEKAEEKEDVTLEGVEEIKKDAQHVYKPLSEESVIVEKEDGKKESEDKDYLTQSYSVSKELLDVLRHREIFKDNLSEQSTFQERNDEKYTESLQIKERIQRHMHDEFEEKENEAVNIPLKPGIPFKNTEENDDIEFETKSKRKLKKKSKQKETPVMDDDFLSGAEDLANIPLRSPEVNEGIDYESEPKRRFKVKHKALEKPIVDEDDYLSAVEDPATLSDLFPEELEPVPEIGSEKWQELMEEIMYENPYEGYVPVETQEPMELVWDRMEREDYRRGLYVDEDMFEDLSIPPVPEKITKEEIEELIERMRRGDGPVSYSAEKG